MFDEIEAEPLSILTGLVKRHDTDVGIVMFSRTPDCKTWTPISEDLILRYEHLGTARCGDHVHPLVRLFLVPPKTEEGRVFLQANTAEAVLAAQAPLPGQMGPARMAGVGAAFRAPMAGPASPFLRSRLCEYDQYYGWYCP